MKSKTFRNCTLHYLEKNFGLRRTFSSQVLDQWLQDKQSMTEAEQLMLADRQEDLRINNSAWNEQELAINFIGPVLSMVRFWDLYRYNFFAGRHLGTQLDSLVDEEKIELSGEPDGMIATGYWEPEVPMFALMEYKREMGWTGDPPGQAVAAMLVAQKLNQDERPMYGCYVVGHQWFFVVLEGKHYTISEGYLATQDTLFDIFRILKALKAIIIRYTADKDE
ncbi:MAG: hypothetical protein AAF639_38725 [Chloroflexota bacterium]